MKLYVASSWRNPLYPPLVAMLRAWKHDVYDFRDRGFSWNELWPEYNDNTLPAQEIINGLVMDRAIEGYNRDKDALDWADACIMAMPCGNSAHAEFGYAVGLNKPTCVLLPYDIKVKPDLI
jgi:hypothetical protein